MLQAESISTLSDHEDDIDDLDGSTISSQEEPLSSNEILELSVQDEKENSLSAFCRLCAGQTANPIYIYSEFGESMKLARKINTCLSIKVKYFIKTILYILYIVILAIIYVKHVFAHMYTMCYVYVL